MAHYECPFQVGDMVIPVKPLNRLEGPNWASGMTTRKETPIAFIASHKVKTDITSSELVMNPMNVSGSSWING